MKRRFLVSYHLSTRNGWAFGSFFHERTDGNLPDPESIAAMQETVALDNHTVRDRIVILAISEVRADGEVVT